MGVGSRWTPGQNVFSAPQSADRLNTINGVLKAYKWGDLSYSPASNGFYNHNFGYAPSFYGFRKIGTSAFTLLGAGSSITGNDLAITAEPEDHFGVSLYTDDTKIQVLTDLFWDRQKATGSVRYYILADRAQQFTGSGGPTTGDGIGTKFVPSGKNVFNAKEYDANVSTKYKAIQYYQVSIKKETLTLPEFRSSYFDPDNQSYTYVDFMHGFDFPPFFRGWYHTGDEIWKEIPFNAIGQVGPLPNDLGFINEEISMACNATKIRVLFKRRSIYTVDGVDSYLSGDFAAKTITVAICPYFINLLQAAN